MLPALVLTAGLGTRLDPLTRLVAKAAVPVAGKSLIERSLERLATQGVTEAVLNLHFRPESITSIVGDGARFGMRVRYSWESPILGSAGGPRRALPLLDSDRFVIINGDTLCDIDLNDMISEHVTRGSLVTMAVVPNPAPEHYNGIRLDADRRVTEFVPKGRAEGTWHFIGVQVVEARVFADLADGVPEETVAGIYRRQVATGPGAIRGYAVSLPFVDVGTPRDYVETALALQSLTDSASDNAIESGAIVDPSARVSRSVLWGDVVVGADVVLDGCIGAGVTLEAGFRAEQSVLVPASVARPGDAAKVVGDVAVFPLSR